MIATLVGTRIETNRLLLIPVHPSHADDIFASFTAEITLYMDPRPAKEICETLEFINSSINELASGTDLQLAILDKSTNQFRGCVGLHDIGATDPELGIWITKQSHGNGFGLEAITAMIDWAKSNIEFDHLKYPVDKKNFPSRRIAELNGGAIKKEYRKINQSGFELNEVEYWIFRHKLAV